MTWTEVNITPAGDHQRVLAELVPLLVAGAKGWFFFREPPEGETLGPDEVLRLRVMTENPDLMFRELDRARKSGLIITWYEGAHGVRGDRYEGEEGFYGAAAWEACWRSWQACSELALTLAELEVAGRLEKPRSFYWKRMAHLIANQLNLPDARICLEQAQRYLSLEPVTDPAVARIINEIDKYLYGGSSD